MKTTTIKKGNKKKTILIISILVIVLLTAAGAYYFLTKKNSSDSPSSTPTTTTNSPNNETDSTEGSQGDNIDTKPNSPSTPSPAPATNQPGTQLQGTGVSVSSKDQTASTYRVRTLIDVLTSEGTCNLTMTKGSQTVSKTVSVQAGPSSSTCAGFDIPMAELSAGAWKLNIVFQNNSHKGEVTEEVTIR